MGGKKSGASQAPQPVYTPVQNPVPDMGPFFEAIGAMQEQFSMMTMSMMQNFQLPDIESYVPEYDPVEIDWEARRAEIREALAKDPNSEIAKRRGISSAIRAGSLISDDDDPDILKFDLSS